MSSSSRPVTASSRPTGPILGGDAWVVPFEPGAAAVWVTASAPEIRALDLRAHGAAPVAASSLRQR